MIGAWLVHLYTASGAVTALMATVNVIENDYRAAFSWLFAAVVVDATDGVFARAARVKERLSWFDGAQLDNIVDYLTYVFVPALIVWQALIVPDRWAVPVCALILLSSAYGFNRTDAKTEDHFFTGFPSYWNIVVFYLYAARWPAAVNTAILVGLGVLVFVPIKYVYPSRTTALQRVTVVFGIAWAIAMLMLLRQLPDVSRMLLWTSLAFPIYYTLLSLALTLTRSGGAARG